MNDPNSQRDEETVIATILDDPRLLRAAAQVKPADFLDNDLSIIWHAILSLTNSGQQVSIAAIEHLTPVTTHERLKEVIKVQARGYEPLRQAIGRVTNVRQAMNAVEILNQTTGRIEKLLKDPLADKSAWASIFHDGFQSGLARNGGHASRNAAMVRNFIRTNSTHHKSRIQTGIACIDQFLGGQLPAASLVAIGAQTKVGKTVFATTLSYNLEIAGRKHIFITTERHEEEIEIMKLGRTLGVPGLRIRQDPKELERLEQTFDPLDTPKRPCHYFHKPGLTIEEIRVEVTRLKMVEEIEAVILDYWQLIQPGARDTTKGHTVRTAQALQQIAVELGIPVIAMVQLDEYGVTSEVTPMKNGANLFMTLHRDRGSSAGYLETQANNIGPEVNIGSITVPSLTLDPAGPHWRDRSKNDNSQGIGTFTQ